MTSTSRRVALPRLACVAWLCVIVSLQSANRNYAAHASAAPATKSDALVHTQGYADEDQNGAKGLAEPRQDPMRCAIAVVSPRSGFQVCQVVVCMPSGTPKAKFLRLCEPHSSCAWLVCIFQVSLSLTRIASRLSRDACA
jgi:hypothetical protein